MNKSASKFKLLILAVFVLLVILVVSISRRASLERTSTRGKASAPAESQPVRILGMVKKVDPCVENFCFKIVEDKTLKSYYLKESPKYMAALEKTLNSLSSASAQNTERILKKGIGRFADKTVVLSGVLFTQPVENILFDMIAIYEKPACRPRPKCLDEAEKPCKMGEPPGGWCAESASSVCKNIGLKSMTPSDPCDNNIGYHKGNYVCNDDFTGTIESQDGKTCFTEDQLRKLGQDRCERFSSCQLTPTPEPTLYGK